MKSQVKRNAFTLIELLVVVAIIALLISILLPSLRDAREQAKVAKCLSNLRSVNTSTVQYLLDWNDKFPITYYDNAGPCSWTFGGKTNHSQWEGDPAYIPATRRPMNRYLLGQEPEPDLMEGNKVIHRTEVPVLFCPGDKQSHQFTWWTTRQPMPIACYDDVGTSYQYNFHGIYGHPHYRVRWGSDMGPDDDVPPGWNDYNMALIKDIMRKNASTFLLFLDDELDWAFQDRIPAVGMHGKFNKHTLGFLDGHASYMQVDSRGFCGVGWSIINPNWVKIIGQPLPAINYQPFQLVNCNPPQN